VISVFLRFYLVRLLEIESSLKKNYFYQLTKLPVKTFATQH